jgi:hypothetical protein
MKESMLLTGVVQAQKAPVTLKPRTAAALKPPIHNRMIVVRISPPPRVTPA